MSVMDDMLAWLQDVLTETEGVARASAEQQRPIIERMEGDDDPHAWRALVDRQPGCPIDSSVFSGDGDGAHVVTTSEDDDLRTAKHIALHDPRAVLARVAAEREIVRLYVAAVEANTEIAEGRETYSIDPDAREQIEAEHYTREDALEEAVAWIAWGHRHDAPGFVTGWAPQDAVVSS